MTIRLLINPASVRHRRLPTAKGPVAAGLGPYTCVVTELPVLSSSSVVHRARRSSTPPPLTTTPRRAAIDSPETRATGAARISGHGGATTSTATALSAPATS